MDSTTLTHIAAILVGVLVTFFLVGGFQKKSDNNETTPSRSAVGVSDGGTAGGSKKKKKKKSSGSKGGGGDQEKTSTPAPESKASKSSKSKSKARTAPAPRPLAASDDSDDDSDDSDWEKEQVIKSKKKGSKTDGNNATNASKKKKSKSSSKPQAAGGATTNFTTANESNKENTTTTVDDFPAYYYDDVPKQQQPKEEEWVTEVSKKKKKSSKPKPSVAVEAAKPAAAAGPAATESVSIDAKKVGIIIGPKGATMKAIEEATGCKVDVNAPSKDEIPAGGASKVSNSTKVIKATVVLSGDKDSVNKARKIIVDLEKKGYSTALQSGDFGEFSILAHPRYLSEFVGPGGKTIQAIQSKLDVKITIPSTDWKPNVPQIGQVKMCKVGIAGSKDNAKQAKAVLQSIMQYHHHEVTHPGMIHESVYVPQEFFHCIIGPRGSEMKHIRGNFKVDVYMPNSETMHEDVLVVGNQTNVDRAIAYIGKLIDRDTEQREKKYEDEFY